MGNEHGTDVGQNGAELIRSGVEGEATEPTPDFAYVSTFREGQPVPLVASVRTPETQAPAARGLLGGLTGLLASGLALAALLPLGGWLVRRRRA